MKNATTGALPKSEAGPYLILLAAIFLSGAAGLINQIAWQRAVKIYLGNSETLSATIVVLVFMLGLGIGSIAASSRAEGLSNPFRTLGAIEVLLTAVNLGLILLFGERLQVYGHGLQRAAAEAGLSSSLVLALLSLAILIIPCFLMGLTIPIAAEAAQRQLRIERNSVVAHFFVLNTVGAVVGTIGCGFLLLPLLGQKNALVFAATSNLVAGVLILAFLGRFPATPTEGSATPATGRGPLFLLITGRRAPRHEEVLAFALGALSLAYEIYLFRITALAYTPLPWIFTAVLCGYLLFWSLGLWISERIPHRIAATL
ncbi:MAG: hypothetical protein AAF725_26475, partial [Acidobacteriota bacterium]